MSSIALIGLPGSGKSTLGRMLADRLNLPFIDIDEEIERTTGRTIAALFEEGESVFRDVESALTSTLSGQDAVLSCGGGIIERPENVEALRRGGRVLFLDRPVEHILTDIDISGRPLLVAGRERLIALNNRRRARYLAAAHAVVENSSDIQHALNALECAARGGEGGGGGNAEGAAL